MPLIEKQSPNRLWICSQIGSREHYAIPRALHRSGNLLLLLTDFWSRAPGFIKVRHSGIKKILERKHPDLFDARILYPAFSRFAFESRARIKGWSTWETTMRRNAWFQECMITKLSAREEFLKNQPPGVFFAYSYAALELLKFFRELGWTTVLGQIDPGIREEEIVGGEIAAHPGLRTTWDKAPARYWENWREETRLADKILVNSEWSRQALVEKDVPREKISVIPLACEKPTRSVQKSYPPRFTHARPLRVLFLGQINVRKGARLVFEAATTLRGEPIEFWMVGPCDISIPAEFRHHPAFRWTGSVSRSQTAEFYTSADVFLLPTFSDGFAITQLEAQARRLPVIASRFCGNVVEHGRNGLIIDPLDSATLASTLRQLAADPELAARLSAGSGIEERFTIDGLTEGLIELENSLSPTRELANTASRE